MIQVAIASVEAVFDWKAYLKETFGYEIDDSWLVDEPAEEVEDGEEGSGDMEEEEGSEYLEETEEAESSEEAGEPEEEI